MTSVLHIFRQVIRMTLCRLLLLNYFILHLNGNNIHLLKKTVHVSKLKCRRTILYHKSLANQFFTSQFHTNSGNKQMSLQAHVLASKCPNKHMSLPANVLTSKCLTSNWPQANVGGALYPQAKVRQANVFASNIS